MQKSKKNNIRFIVQRTIGLLILIIVISRIDFAEFAGVIGQSKVPCLLIAVLLFLPSLFLRSLRLFLIMKSQGTNLKIWESITVYGYSIFVGSITPGRLGEFIKAVYLSKKGTPVSASLYGTVLDRLFDVLLISIIGSTIFFSITTIFKEINSIVILVYLIAITSLSVAVLKSSILKIIFGRVEKIFARNNLAGKISSNHLDAGRFVTQLSTKSILISLIITTLALICNFSSIYYLAKSLGLEIPYFDMLGISALVSLVSMIPITILGLGTRDLVLIQVLSVYGIDKVSSIALSTLILFLLIFNALICSFSLLTNVGNLRWDENNRNLN